jgi:hypothetical protein
MKKTVYIVLIVIMALVIILTAVLLILNLKGKDNDGTQTSALPSPSISASASPSMSAEPSASPSESPSSSPSPSNAGYIIREETPDGTQYTIQADDDVIYRLTVDEAVLPYAGDQQDGQTFQSPNPDHEDYLKIMFIADAKAADLAPSFLNAYIAFTEFEQSGVETITGTAVAGEKIAAGDGTTQVEAWLVDTGAGTLAVVISYTLSDKDALLKELDAALATFEIKPENAEGWAEVTMPQTGG